MHELTILGHPLFTDRSKLASITDAQEIETHFPGLLAALLTAKMALEMRRLRVGKFTYVENAVRAWPEDLYWHCGPTEMFQVGQSMAQATSSHTTSAEGN